MVMAVGGEWRLRWGEEKTNKDELLACLLYLLYLLAVAVIDLRAKKKKTPSRVIKVRRTWRRSDDAGRAGLRRVFVVGGENWFERRHLLARPRLYRDNYCQIDLRY